jgi:hypothetical protein
MDSWPRASFLALDALSALLLFLSYFLYRARNWARRVLMGGCICITVLAIVGGVALGISDPYIADEVYITGLLLWVVAGPLFMVLMLRQPAVVADFGGSIPN